MNNANKPCAHGWAAKLNREMLSVSDEGVTYRLTCSECKATWTIVDDKKLAQIALLAVKQVLAPKVPTKICPDCGMDMIKEYSNFVTATIPAGHPYTWFCGCGHTDSGGIDHDALPPTTRQRWERVNGVAGSEVRDE